MSIVSIRIATMQDYDAICRLLSIVDAHHVNILPGYFKPFPAPPRTREVVASFIEHENADYIVAEDDKKIVGFINIIKGSHPTASMFKKHDFAMIENLVVDEQYRNHGIASSLFEEAEKWTKARGLKFIQLTVWAANSVATEFYKKRGFRPLTIKQELELD